MSSVLSSLQVCTSTPSHYKRGLWPLTPIISFITMGGEGEGLGENIKKWAIIIRWEGLVLCEWVLTGWGRRTGNASPPALPSGHPAGSYECTALFHTGFLFLWQEAYRIQSLWGVCNTSDTSWKKHQSAQMTEKHSAPYLCRGEDEFQKDKEVLKRSKDKETERGGCVGWR